MQKCQKLKDEIERLINDSTLWKFTREDREERRPEPKVRTTENTTDSEPMGVIHVIVRGPNDGKEKKVCC